MRGLITHAPEFFKTQLENLDLVNRFCKTLELKISESLKAGTSNVILLDEPSAAPARDLIPRSSATCPEEPNHQTPIESLENSFQAAKISADLSNQPKNPSLSPDTDHLAQVHSAAPNQPPGTIETIPTRQIPNHSPLSASPSPARTKPKKKSPRKRKSSIQDNTAPKEKRTRRPLTYFEKEERARKAAQRKDQRLSSVHAEVMCPADLMDKFWEKTKCDEAREEHKQMLIKSRNPRWDYGPPLMSLVIDMIEWFADDTYADSFYTNLDLFTPSAEAMEAFRAVLNPAFKHCIAQSPCLLQVDSRDPFFQKNVLRLESISNAFISTDSIKAYSWQALYGMMIRTDHNSPYTNDEFTKAGLESAIDKLLGLAVMCYYNLDHYMLRTNNTNSEHPLAEDHSIVIAGHYIISKIRAIKTSSDTPANTTVANNKNGLLILQKRIWETLLCCLMMQQSKLSTDQSIPSKSSDKNQGRSLFQVGDVKDPKSQEEMKEWGKIRLSAFGSMAVFFLYGTAGWWHCLVNSHQFNQKDVWAITQLAHAKTDFLYNHGQDDDREAKDIPWYTMDSFVRWLLRESGMHSRKPCKIKWENAPKFWASHVNDTNLSRFALLDLLNEVCAPEPSKSLNYNGEAAPDVTFNPEIQTQVNNLRSRLRAPWLSTITGYKDRIDAHEKQLEEGRQQQDPIVNQSQEHQIPARTITERQPPPSLWAQASNHNSTSGNLPTSDHPIPVGGKKMSLVAVKSASSAYKPPRFNAHPASHENPKATPSTSKQHQPTPETSGPAKDATHTNIPNSANSTSSHHNINMAVSTRFQPPRPIKPKSKQARPSAVASGSVDGDRVTWSHSGPSQPRYTGEEGGFLKEAYHTETDESE
ncbi:Golgi to ER traffic- protein [Puccinia graminis f. sp. tritici]|nr:Golgi to ER traffic- protein [Puccinia graminis f. sp. tritici]